MFNEKAVEARKGQGPIYVIKNPRGRRADKECFDNCGGDTEGALFLFT